MAQQAPEFKLVLVGDGGVGMYSKNSKTTIYLDFYFFRKNNIR